MTIRIEVGPDLKIEVMKSHRVKECNVFFNFDTVERAIIHIRYWLKMELDLATNNRFKPQIIKEARRAFKQLQEKSPYGKKS